MRRGKILCGIVLITLAIAGPGKQGVLLAQHTRQYPFIQYDTNYIFNPVDRQPVLGHFYSKLDSLLVFGQGRVNVLHLGGSHIQTDVYPQVVRTSLQNLQPQLFGGRGFIFPVSMTSSNNPKNFSVSWSGRWEKCRNTERSRTCNLGIAGLALHTCDSLATISFRSFSGIPASAHNLIRIYHFDALDAYAFNLKTDDQYLINNIRYFPDQGYSEISLNIPVDTFTLEIYRTTSALSVFELYGIELLLDGPGITYSSLGVNGASIPSFLRCNLFGDQLKVLNPDLVIISLGTNDGFTRDFNPEVYKRNYIRLINLIQEACPETDLLLTVPNDVLIKKKRSNKNTSLQEEVIYQLAETYQCGVWNFFRVMGGHNSVPAWYINGLMQRDRVHFTTPGYQIKGELLYEAILKSYSTHLELKASQKQL